MVMFGGDDAVERGLNETWIDLLQHLCHSRCQKRDVGKNRDGEIQRPRLAQDPFRIGVAEELSAGERQSQRAGFMELLQDAFDHLVRQCDVLKLVRNVAVDAALVAAVRRLDLAGMDMRVLEVLGVQLGLRVGIEDLIVGILLGVVGEEGFWVLRIGELSVLCRTLLFCRSRNQISVGDQVLQKFQEIRP